MLPKSRRVLGLLRLAGRERASQVPVAAHGGWADLSRPPIAGLAARRAQGMMLGCTLGHPMTSSCIATTPQPPYYAVIFSNQRSASDPEGYAAMAARMVELAAVQPGFLGVESTRDAQGFGITVSYWTSEEAIAQWKANAEHQQAQALGHARWYAQFALRVARVERAYGA